MSEPKDSDQYKMIFVNGDVRESLEHSGRTILRRFVLLRCIEILDDRKFR